MRIIWLRRFKYAHEADPPRRCCSTMIIMSPIRQTGENLPVGQDGCRNGERRFTASGCRHIGIFIVHRLTDIRASIERYASLGVQLQITEMEVSV